MLDSEHKIKYSFVVVSKNEENYISHNLQAIADLNLEKSEVLLIDNGSTDKTLEIARKFDISIFVEPDLKVGALRNFGASRSKGSILVFLDSDVVIDRLWFDSLVRHVETGESDCVFAPESWYGDPVKIEKAWLTLKGRGDKSIRMVRWCQSGAFIVSSVAFNAVGGFNTALGSSEDYDFGVRFSQFYTILRDGNVCFRHIRTPKTIKDLFLQQIWHGQGSFRGFWMQKFDLREFVATYLPVVFVVLFLMTFVFLLLESHLTYLSLVSFVAIYIVYCFRKIKSIDCDFLLNLFLVFIFIFSRGISLFLSGKRLVP